MNKVFLALFILLFPYCTNASWQTELHGPSNPALIATDSSGTRILLSLQNYGGVWLTNDGGDNWNQINDRITTAPMLKPAYECDIQSVGSAGDTLIINLFPTYPDSTRIVEYHSLDGGDNWHTFSYLINNFWPDTLDNISFNGDPTLILSDRIYYSRQSGFGISYDSGQNWNIINLNPYQAGIQGVLFDHMHPDTVYAYGWWGMEDMEYMGGVICSHNGGISWQRLTQMEVLTPAEEGFFADLRKGPGSELYALVVWAPSFPHPPILYSPDEGTTWNWVVPDGLPERVSPDCIMPVPERPGRVLLGCLEAQGIWESNDGGHNWHRLFRGLPEVAARCASFYRNPYSGNLYICLNHQGVYWSSDSGDTWQPLPGPPIGAQCDWFYDGFVIDEGGVFHKSHYPPVYYAEDESITFQQVPAFDTNNEYYNCYYYPISYNSNTQIISRTRINMLTNQSEHNLIKSIDNGLVWTESNPSPVTLNNVISVHLDSTQVIIGTSDFSSIHISYDMGSTWNYQDVQFNFGYFMEELEGNIIVGTLNTNADIMISPDLGINWSSLQFPEPDIIRYGLLTKPLVVSDTLLVSAENQVWAYLPDGIWQQRGITWDQNIEGLDDVAWAYVETDADSFIFAGCDQSRDFSTSYDHGWTWEHQSVELPGDYQGEVVLDLAYDKWRDRIWVDTALGLMYLDDPTSAVGEEVWVFQPANYVTLDAYPNPFNATATVRYTLTRPGDVKLTVFDLLGRQVADLYDGVARPGEHTFQFDGSGMSSGTYFLHLTTDEQTINRKMTLVK